MGKPFQESGLTVTLDSEAILDLYDCAPFTRKPTCDLLLCAALRRFYVVVGNNTFTHAWVNDRGQLIQGVSWQRHFRKMDLDAAQIAAATWHLTRHHLVRVVPHRYEGVKFWVPHNPRDVRGAIGYVGVGTDLSHLL